MKWFAATIGLLGWCGFASAQFPGQYGQQGFGSGGYGGFGGPSTGGMFMPNIFNPQTQPLSPYMNMFRGAGNPAANYYFGTRPGTVGGGRMGMGGAPNIAMGGNRALFFPELATGPDPLELPEADPHGSTVLPSAGHPVFYNNTMGYFPIPFGYRGFGGMRPGLMGGGNNNRQQGASAPRR